MLEAIDWQLFTLLLIAGFIGLLSVLPLRAHYIQLIAKPNDSQTNEPSNLFAHLLSHNIQFLQLIVAVLGGLLLCNHLGLLGAPLISGILNGADMPDFWQTITLGISAGLVAGAIVSMLMLFTSQDNGPNFFSIPLWKRMLAGVFQGGIFEELWYRLFLLSLFAWLISFVFGLQVHQPSNTVFWIANIAAALMFGIDHLPSLDEVKQLAKKDIALTLSFNGGLGLVYGYLFWHWGIEAAMLAHLGTHLVIQPCVPYLLKIKRSH